VGAPDDEDDSARARLVMAVSCGRTGRPPPPPNRPGADCSTMLCLWFCGYHARDPPPPPPPCDDPCVDPELAGSRPGMLLLELYTYEYDEVVVAAPGESIWYSIGIRWT
jgi:hypothetical protein